jgi:hypothetical protein
MSGPDIGKVRCFLALDRYMADLLTLQKVIFDKAKLRHVEKFCQDVDKARSESSCLFSCGTTLMI